MNRSAENILAGLMPPRRRVGFTLIEMLVVIGLIVVLLSIVLAVGPSLLKNQRSSQTKGVLSALDRALDEYRLANGAFPKINANAYANVPSPDWATPGDGLNITTPGAAYRTYPSGGTYARRPDAAVFVAAALGTGEVSSIIHNIPSQFSVPTPTDNDNDMTPSMLDGWSTSNATAWGQSIAPGGKLHPWVALKNSYILYVEPGNLVAQELYGRCVNGRPYFISAGPDGKFGLEDEFWDWDAGQPPLSDSTAEQKLVTDALTDNITSYPVTPPNLSTSWTYRQKQ